jgi:hypothetical protein
MNEKERMISFSLFGIGITGIRRGESYIVGKGGELNRG